jgi:thymidylate synthase ThyX
MFHMLEGVVVGHARYSDSIMMDAKPDALDDLQRAQNETDVYAIHGAEPEVLAYAMAKYSRSALTLRESLAEISSQRAEQFLNTFYFQYGHRSIADLAHIPFAIERLSLLAAIALVDEQRWDGQERSTRYQDFRKSGWFTPGGLGPQEPGYTAAVQALFAAYNQVGEGMAARLKEVVARPEAMKPDAYDRTLKARAFDVARYLLPLATNTSLGQIVNARTLETQVSRLLTSEAAEIRVLGEKLREAATEPAWDVNHKAGQALMESLEAAMGARDGRIEQQLLKPVKAAPTLVKYAVANDYAKQTRFLLTQAATELMGGAAIAPAPVVDLLDDEPLEVELAASLLYPHCHYSYRQLRDTVAGLDSARRAEIVALGTQHRGPHDELVRPFHAGSGLRFDLLMDIGGFRDMHRHRRCTQLLQDFTDAHGFEIPDAPGQPTLAEAGLAEGYDAAMQAAFAAYREVRDSGIEEAQQSARYCLPLGTRCRSLFKMDFAEALYISELRSGVAGHYSYRRVAWEMYREVQRKHPELASLFRISDVNEPVDLLRR